MKIGLDVGSTTIKAVVLDDSGELLYSSYRRHYSQIVQNAAELIEDIQKNLPSAAEAKIALSGSAGMGLAERCGIPFVQEVYATSLCAEVKIPDTDVIIELGGEDAKILFLSGMPDARMNGSCAGGTGAFIDQMATLLKITPEELNRYAASKEKVYAIASRCGVFAKSDIQPLLNQGAKLEDVCASILYSVVNQTVAGLAQGRRIEGRVAYLGGPLTFMDELRAAFDRILKLNGVLPEDSLYFVAIGAALYAEQELAVEELKAKLLMYKGSVRFESSPPLFSDEKDYEEFVSRHGRDTAKTAPLEGFSGRAHLGIDAGSTTVKTVLVSEEGEILHMTYKPNSGNPVPLISEAMLDIFSRNPALNLASMTTTGYGEELCREAFKADFSIVETMAHYRAARYFMPDVDFIIDIGGQDMKCFRIEDSSISDIFLNEACSSGCGSFLQTFAEALGMSVSDFAGLALYGDAPVELGSRCTGFMNSSVKQAQKDGASIENISAGLAVSIVKNALYKVIRTTRPSDLGTNIVVQGGTFYNDAVLRAFEREMGTNVIRPSIAGLMGAFGAALYGIENSSGKVSVSLNEEEIKTLTHSVKTANCGLCTNNCTLTFNTFSGKRQYISGNRCERPVSKKKTDERFDLYEYKQQLLDKYTPVPGRRGKIGIPLVLNMFEMLPFWHAFFTHLEFEVHVSPPSTRSLYFDGQATIPSDTVCYPAKLAHGHINALSKMKDLKAVFYPCLSYNFDEGLGDNHYNCPVVAYYPEVIKASCSELSDMNFIYDHAGVHKRKYLAKKLHGILKPYFGDLKRREIKAAVDRSYESYDEYMNKIRTRGAQIIEDARKEGMQIIVLAGRPYHIDREVNHGINKLITNQGAAVISEDAVSHLSGRKKIGVLNQWTYHARMFSAAHYISDQSDMNLVQLVSFGCGLDAITSDEIRSILQDSSKLYTQIKIDEIVNLGAVNIRLRSLFAAIEMAHSKIRSPEAAA